MNHNVCQHRLPPRPWIIFKMLPIQRCHKKAADIRISIWLWIRHRFHLYTSTTCFPCISNARKTLELVGSTQHLFKSQQVKLSMSHLQWLSLFLTRFWSHCIYSRLLKMGELCNVNFQTMLLVCNLLHHLLYINPPFLIGFRFDRASQSCILDIVVFV